jgi:hypothetical protein
MEQIIEIKARDIAKAMLFAAYKDTRWYLNGIFIEILSNSRAVIASTDGHALYAELVIPPGEHELPVGQKFILMDTLFPKATLNNAAKDYGSTVKLVLSDPIESAQYDVPMYPARAIYNIKGQEITLRGEAYPGDRYPDIRFQLKRGLKPTGEQAVYSMELLNRVKEAERIAYRGKTAYAEVPFIQHNGIGPGLCVSQLLPHTVILIMPYNAGEEYGKVNIPIELLNYIINW